MELSNLSIPSTWTRKTEFYDNTQEPKYIHIYKLSHHVAHAILVSVKIVGVPPKTNFSGFNFKYLYHIATFNETYFHDSYLAQAYSQVMYVVRISGIR